jgi:hypothetical protein
MLTYMSQFDEIYFNIFIYIGIFLHIIDKLVYCLTHFYIKELLLIFF